MFITFEGLDGSGKTTVLKEFSKKLREFFPTKEIIETREPGGKDLVVAEKLREIILDPSSDLSPVVEAMLYSTSRRIHLEKVVWPSLEQGKIVICDRYIDSFYAYQGFARDLGYQFTKDLTNLIINKSIPDITIFLDITPEDAKKRRDSSRLFEDRLENEKLEFHHKVDQGFKHLINEDPERFVVVDGLNTPEEVCDEIFET